MNHTTRRFPRTFNEAFGTGTEYANSIERHRRADHSGLVIVVFVVAFLGIAWCLS